MVDTNWPDFPDTNYVEETDILLALRGAGGVNIPGSAFVKKRSDGHVAIQRGGAGAQELILSLDAGSTGFNVRDSQIRAGNNGSNQTYLDFYTSNAAAPARAMRIDPVGNIGIGTASPSNNLHVVTGGGTRVQIEGGATSYPTLAIKGARAFLWQAVPNADAAGGLRLWDETSGVERMRVDPSGNVGIGNNSPSQKLHVAGAILSNNLLMQGDNSDAYVRATVGTLYLGAANATVCYVASGGLAPATDNSKILGSSAQRWSVVYAATGTINTSDERAKQDIAPIPDEWLDAWGTLEWVRYKFKDAVAAKGDDARWHVGLIAQRVRDAFDAAGLDALAIGLICYDEWEEQREPIIEEQVIDKRLVVIGQEETGVLGPDGAEIMRDVTSEEPVMGPVQVGERVTLEAGDRWGLRYDECQAMEAAWQRRELARNSAISEERIAGLEAMNKLLSDRLAALEAA